MFIPNSPRVALLVALNNIFSFTCAKLLSTKDNTSLPSIADATMLGIATALIALATVVALPIGTVTKKPLINTFLGVVTLTSLVPIIIPYLPPPFV